MFIISTRNKILRHTILLLGLVAFSGLWVSVTHAEYGNVDPAARGYTDTSTTQDSTGSAQSNTSNSGSGAIQGSNYTEYRLLAPLPFIGNTLSLQNGDRQSSFANYVNSLYRLMVLVGSVLAVVMFAIGGFLYMTGEALDTKESGRSRMRGAVLGLLLLLAPYIILNAINPDLLKLSLNIPGVSYVTTAITQPPPPPPELSVASKPTPNEAAGVGSTLNASAVLVVGDRDCPPGVAGPACTTWVNEKITNFKNLCEWAEVNGTRLPTGKQVKREGSLRYVCGAPK